MKSKVFAIDMRAGFKENLFDKLSRLLIAAGLADCLKSGNLTAIKLNFGERGNTGFVRPIFVRRVVEEVTALGAQPFLTDANTLYGGTRNQSAGHLATAVANGFAYSVVGAPITIADGLKGNSEVEVETGLAGTPLAYIAHDIYEADALISLAHFKGHELAGFGGTIKNLGMGAAAKRGKLYQHSDLSPKVKSKHCDACADCLKVCGYAAIALIMVEGKKKARINPEKCIGCAECIPVCPSQAIRVQWSKDGPRFMKKMVDYTFAVLKNKKNKTLLLNFVTQISPGCDCFPHSDAPLVGDVGILASMDPVAIDQASADLVNQAPGLIHSCLKEGREPGADKFRALYPQTDWTIQLNHGREIGLGSRDYDLVWLENK